MSILFGIVFLLSGLALSVFLGIVLYRDPEKERRPHGAALRTEKDPKTA
jgi:hypothetical protein